jgi:hypothetical protein
VKEGGDSICRGPDANNNWEQDKSYFVRPPSLMASIKVTADGHLP